MEATQGIATVDISADGERVMVVDAVNNVYMHRWAEEEEKFKLEQKVAIEGA